MKRRHFLLSAGAGLAAASRASAAPVTPEAKPMKVLLWCWDARMTWDDEPERAAKRMAASEQAFPYLKRPESYQVGFRRLIDYCAETGIWGVIIWGFLRDAHGGVGAAVDLCKYASDRGVAILPGVGLCSYGGFYYQGEHPFNLDTYLKAHPDRRSTAKEERGGRSVSPVLDPSVEANQKWWREGLEWMLDTFEIGGINFEMGDFVVNPSESATAARKALALDTDENIKEMVVATRGLLERANELKPDGAFVNALYRGYHQISGFPKTPYVDAVHPKTVWEYTLRHMVSRPEFPKGYGGIQAHRQYGYLHWFNTSTGTADKDYTAEIARVFPGLSQLGFEFAGTYGEITALNNPVGDANYRCQVKWAKAAPEPLHA